MKVELQNKLYAKYPKIFADKDKSMQETCMCWGIETGSGWYDIIDDLCKQIQEYIDESGCEQVIATQVKEKFGTLRFYFYGGDDTVDRMVLDAERKSYITCEECGKPGTSNDRGWIRVRCGDCDEKDI